MLHVSIFKEQQNQGLKVVWMGVFYLLSFLVLNLLVFTEPTKNGVKGVSKS